MTFHFTLLHLDDDILEHRSLQRQLKTSSFCQFEFYTACNLEEFQQHLQEIPQLDFVVLDIFFAENSDVTGMSLIEKVIEKHPQATIFMSSNLDNPQVILDCLKLGADEFLSKKNKVENLPQRFFQVRQRSLLKKGFLNSSSKNASISGKMMQKIQVRVPNIIKSAIRFVYVEGESGTGKEVVADLFEMAAKGKPFVKLNCAAIAKDLMESELFGHKKGAFTGALSDKKGVIESAHGGWLFLDEVSSLTPPVQAALLRALENQEVTPIGESRARKVDVRYLSASNIPLASMVAKGDFRNDLWQRLRETEIVLKPLYLRKDEIPGLVQHFCQQMEGGPYSIEETALKVLSQLSWREGNVRELRNCLRAMTENHHDKVLSPMSIPERYLNNQLSSQRTSFEIPSNSSLEKQEETRTDGVWIFFKNEQGNTQTWEKMEQILFENIVCYFNNRDGNLNLSKMSRELKLARSTLQLRIKQQKDKMD